MYLNLCVQEVSANMHVCHFEFLHLLNHDDNDKKIHTSYSLSTLKQQPQQHKKLISFHENLMQIKKKRKKTRSKKIEVIVQQDPFRSEKKYDNASEETERARER